MHQVQFARAYVGLMGGKVVVDAPASTFDEAAFANLYGAERAVSASTLHLD
jgi:ABC-type phosphate/phosphonate transport system ATPase subunit